MGLGVNKGLTLLSKINPCLSGLIRLLIEQVSIALLTANIFLTRGIKNECRIKFFFMYKLEVSFNAKWKVFYLRFFNATPKKLRCNIAYINKLISRAKLVAFLFPETN
jgi:choline-glycine betaine transporter